MKPTHRFFSPTAFAVALIALGVGLRLVRHFGWLSLPPNFSPVSALAMLSGTVLPRRFAFVVPLGLMLASDLIIGFYALPVMVSVYLCFAASNLLGLRLRRRFGLGRLALSSLTGSLLFFLVTNAAVWAFQSMYPQTIAGLGQAYVAGLPFFRNTVAGDLVYSGLFFGLYQLAVVYWKHRVSLVPQTTIDG